MPYIYIYIKVNTLSIATSIPLEIEKISTCREITESPKPKDMDVHGTRCTANYLLLMQNHVSDQESLLHSPPVPHCHGWDNRCSDCWR